MLPSRTLQRGLRPLLFVVVLAGHFLLFSFPASGQVGAKLTGVVYYNGGKMPGFPVSLYSRDEVLQTESDKAGHFEFSDLPPGTYDLQARYFGVEGTIYSIQVADKDLGPLTVTLNLVESIYPLAPDCGRTFWASYKQDMTAGGQLSGLLTLSPNVPLPSKLLANVRIDLTKADESHRRISQHIDENGKFEFQNVPPGRYFLLAHYRGYRKVQSTIWVMRKDTTETKIILHKRGDFAICE